MKVIITGASRGIGFEMVKQFLSNGHQVMAISRNKVKLIKLEKLGAKILAFDVANEDFRLAYRLNGSSTVKTSTELEYVVPVVGVCPTNGLVPTLTLN